MSTASDVRAFYAALGIELPGSSKANATMRCFADPDAHAHEDRTPSCSVSLEHGAWRCWGCGARGGAYDAALAHGHTPASAIELLIEYGLAERREPRERRVQRHVTLSRQLRAAERAAARPLLAVTETDVRRWHHALFAENGEQLRELLWRERLWCQAVMRELELGLDGGRVTIPIRGSVGQLRGVLRYRPAAPARKMLAVPGTRLGLIPHPARERSRRVLLVEGPPDMIAARSRGWPAIAVPGDHAWQPSWAELLKGRTVTVLMDCDSAGRAAAKRIAADLADVAPVRVVDLAPARNDGFDLTDWLLAQQPKQRRLGCTRSSSSRPTITR